MTDTSKAIAFGAKTPDTIEPTDKRIEVRDLKYDGLRLVVQPLPSGKKTSVIAPLSRQTIQGDDWQMAERDRRRSACEGCRFRRATRQR